MPILFLGALAILRSQGILNLTLWKLKEITLLTLLQGMLPSKASASVKPLSCSKADNLEKLAREAQ